VDRDFVRALGSTFSGTQWMTAAEIEAYRLPLLAKLLAHARKQSPFYRDRFGFDITSLE
jgi:phenylacetate-coenzyme A ligase PaaK-like adenylate-forming protein